jgi:hypothetical protein
MDLGNMLGDVAGSLGIDTDKIAAAKFLIDEYNRLMADGQLSADEVWSEVMRIAKEKNFDQEIIDKAMSTVKGLI